MPLDGIIADTWGLGVAISPLHGEGGRSGGLVHNQGQLVFCSRRKGLEVDLLIIRIVDVEVGTVDEELLAVEAALLLLSELNLDLRGIEVVANNCLEAVADNGSRAVRHSESQSTVCFFACLDQLTPKLTFHHDRDDCRSLKVGHNTPLLVQIIITDTSQ